MKRIMIIVAILVVAIGAVVAALFVLPKKSAPPKPIQLTYWGVWDESSNFATAFALYNSQHPYISITYKKFRYEEYEDALLNAWARDTGPDIFSLPVELLPKYEEFITALPATTTVYNIQTVKRLGVFTEKVVEPVVTTSLTPTDLRNGYIDLVAREVVRNNKILALPLGIDTMVMYVNRDHLNAAALPEPPKTWDAFIQAVSKLSVVDSEGAIIRSGTAMGTATNVSRSQDLLALLMMQNGTDVVDPTGTSVRLTLPSAGDPNYKPGEEALRFYTDFARPEKVVYSWNAAQPTSLDAFALGKVSLLFGYPYQEATIKARATNLNYRVAAVPQVNLTQPVNMATLWAETVSRKSAHANEAWDFLQYLSRPDVVTNYLTASQRTPVIRSLLTPLVTSTDPATSILASQALTAKTWYRGYNLPAAEAAMQEMIDATLKGEKTLAEILALAGQKIQLTLAKR